MIKNTPIPDMAAKRNRVIAVIAVITLSCMVISGAAVCMFFGKIAALPGIIVLIMMTAILIPAARALCTYGNPVIKTLQNQMEYLQNINEELELEISIRRETESALKESEAKAVNLMHALKKIRENLEQEVEKHTNSLRRQNEILQKEIEERMRAEAKLKEKQLLLVQAGRLASLGEMATGVAHELNQPLSLIRLYAELSLSMLEKMEQKELAAFNFSEKMEGIIKAVDRAAVIIHHLQDFSRPRNTYKIKLNPLIPLKQALLFFKQYLKENGFVFITDFQETLPEILIDFHQLEEIAVNLMSNAIYAVEQKAVQSPATCKGGCRKEVQIRLYHQKHAQAVTLEVSDNGIGMTDHEKSHCLEPFFTTREVGEGTGLGLSIVHGILRELNGRIEIESRKNAGTKIRIILPCL